MTETKTIEIDNVLSREIFEAAQAVRLLEKLSKGSGSYVGVHYLDEPERNCIVFVNGYSFVGRTLLEALEMANPLLESLRK